MTLQVRHNGPNPLGWEAPREGEEETRRMRSSNRFWLCPNGKRMSVNPGTEVGIFSIIQHP